MICDDRRLRLWGNSRPQAQINRIAKAQPLPGSRGSAPGFAPPPLAQKKNPAT
jgi:hypothetical protein